MGYKVGIPCMKCSLNPSQQVNSRTGKASKTCGVGSAWREMNDERLGRDTTIDKELTERNVWMVGDTNDDVEKMVKDEIDRINLERKENGLRSLRKDAVSVVEIIEKPPISFMENLSYEDQIKFLNDSHETMKGLIHDWNPNWKIIESVQHHDEFGGRSPHNHSLVMLSSVDENGVATMQAKSEFNLKFFTHINENYAKAMREKGYDVEDCKIFDRLSEEEKKWQREHPEQHGVDAYTFKKKKLEEMDSKLSERKELMDAPSIDSYTDVVKQNAELKKELSLKDKLINALTEEREKLKEVAEKWKSRFTDITEKAGSKLMEAFGYKVNNPNLPEYPKKDIASQFKEKIEPIKEKTSKDYKVISDNENQGKFRIVTKNEEGKYETVKGNFDSRDAADKFRKNISETAQALSEDITQIKNGLGRAR